MGGKFTIYRNRVRCGLRMTESTREYTCYCMQLYTHPLESTNRSRLNHFEFLGFALKKLHRIGDQIESQDGFVIRTEKKGHGRPVPCPSEHLRHTSASVPADGTRSGVYAPGCPELALPTTSAARARMVAMATSSTGSLVNLDMTVDCEMGGRGCGVRGAIDWTYSATGGGTCSQR